MKKFGKRFLCMVLVAVVLASVAVTASAAGGGDFSDVPSTKWSYKAVMNAREKGYVNGVGGNRFDPYGKITFGQLAQVLYNMAGRPRYLCIENNCIGYSRKSFVGDMQTLEQAKAWEQEVKKLFGNASYCKENYDLLADTVIIDLTSSDCVDQAIEKVHGECGPLFTNGSRDYLGYNSRGKWFTSAFVWAHCMGMLDRHKSAYDLATRGDIVYALSRFDYWENGLDYTHGEWVLQDPDSIHAARLEEMARGEYSYGENIDTTRFEDGKLYHFEGTMEDPYAYFADEYEENVSRNVYGWAIENHILAGNGSRSRSGKKVLNLEGNVTREEFAQFLYNYDVNIG